MGKISNPGEEENDMKTFPSGHRLCGPRDDADPAGCRGLSPCCSGAAVGALTRKWNGSLERGAKIRARKNQQQNRRKCQSEMRTQVRAARPQARKRPQGYVGPRRRDSPCAGAGACFPPGGLWKSLTLHISVWNEPALILNIPPLTCVCRRQKGSKNPVYLRVIIVSESFCERVVIYFQLRDLGKERSRAHVVKAWKIYPTAANNVFKGPSFTLVSNIPFKPWKISSGMLIDIAV